MKFLIAIWAFGVSILIIAMSMNKVTYFDHSSLLYKESMSPEFESELKKELSVQSLVGNEDFSSLTVLFESETCFCEQLSQSHINQIENKSKLEKINFKRLYIQSGQLRQYVPSTPAIIIFDKSGKLSYLGPISTGAFCSTKNSIFDNLIRKDFENILPGGIINSEVQGCFCNR